MQYYLEYLAHDIATSTDLDVHTHTRTQILLMMTAKCNSNCKSPQRGCRVQRRTVRHTPHRPAADVTLNAAAHADHSRKLTLMRCHTHFGATQCVASRKTENRHTTIDTLPRHPWRGCACACASSEASFPGHKGRMLTAEMSTASSYADAHAYHNHTILTLQRRTPQGPSSSSLTTPLPFPQPLQQTPST
jgi:hypothetical protein